MTSHTMNELWAHLRAQGHVDGEMPVLDKQSLHSAPWYVAGLVGIAGWLAAAFLIAMLGLLGVIDSDRSMLIIGGVFCLVALGIKYVHRNEIFSSQLAFALSLAGQGLIIASQLDSSNVSRIVLTILVLEGLLFLLYPDGLHRLLSLSAIIVALVAQMVDWSLEWYVPLFVLLLAIASISLWYWNISLRSNWGRSYFNPVSLGLPMATLGLCILQLIDSGFTDGPWWIVASGIAGILLLLGFRILSDLEISIPSAAGVALGIMLLILMVPSYETPGIMAAIFLLVLGFWRRENLLMGVGIVGFGLFMSFYYYNLEITLLTKSLILMGSGCALIILRLISRNLWGSLEAEEGSVI